MALGKLRVAGDRKARGLENSTWASLRTMAEDWGGRSVGLINVDYADFQFLNVSPKVNEEHAEGFARNVKMEYPQIEIKIRRLGYSYSVYLENIPNE